MPLPPNVRQAHQIGFETAIAKAVRYLEGTADDYEQMARRKEKDLSQAGLLFASVRQEIAAFKDKAKLLRGQADHISKLRGD